MANNRMYLVYRPTGDAVFLGKRMGGPGYYQVPADLNKRVERLFELADNAVDASMDDFAIALESGEFQPHCIDDWKYSDILKNDGTRKLIISEDVPYGGYEKV